MKLKKISPNAILPQYATNGAACFDLASIESKTIAPGQMQPVRTGWAFELPVGKALMLYSRSGHGFKAGVRLTNCVGVIDSDYRGEVMVGLRNDGQEPFTIAAGDRIAQGMIIDCQPAAFEVVEDLAQTQRGDGGFGSTGG